MKMAAAPPPFGGRPGPGAKAATICESIEAANISLDHINQSIRSDQPWYVTPSQPRNIRDRVNIPKVPIQSTRRDGKQGGREWQP